MTPLLVRSRGAQLDHVIPPILTNPPRAPPCRRPRRDHRVRRPPVRAPGPRRPAIARSPTRHACNGPRSCATSCSPASWPGARRSLNANCFHPGVVRTGFAKNENGIWKVIAMLGAPFLRSPERGARRAGAAALSDDAAEAQMGSTSRTTRGGSPPATRPRTTTSHGACGTKRPSRQPACRTPAAPGTPRRRDPLLASLGASVPRPSSVPGCAEGTLLEVASRGIRKPIGLLGRAVFVPVATRTRCGSGARVRAGRVRRWLSRRAASSAGAIEVAISSRRRARPSTIDAVRIATPSPRAARSATALGALACSGCPAAPRVPRSRGQRRCGCRCLRACRPQGGRQCRPA